jgi:hypothetical protein
MMEALFWMRIPFALGLLGVVLWFLWASIVRRQE